LANQFHILEGPYSPYYKYETQVAPENGNYKLCWDRTLLTGKSVHFNRPDVITLTDETNKEAAFIGITIPLTHSLQATITEKQRKYEELAFESSNSGN